MTEVPMTGGCHRVLEQGVRCNSIGGGGGGLGDGCAALLMREREPVL